ncbi:tRNA (adenosine(37)-N6)-dimethylallyltransferase MiaA [Pseudomonadota bacterium]
MQKIVIISGATAAGKSPFALSLAKKCNGVIINADSMQIYSGLPILSAQPPKEECKIVKHYLYSILKPEERRSVGIWIKLAQAEIDKARRMRRVPIVVGGTGMYISSLINGLPPIPDIKEITRRSVKELYEKLGHEKFFDLVSTVDKKTCDKIKKNDKQRLLRAYEVFAQTGKPLSQWQKVRRIKPYKKNEFLHINIEIPREELYKKINKRYEQMLQGDTIINEVKDFLKKYPKAIEENYTIKNTLGFLEIKDFLDGKISHKKMIEIATQKTRNYAKRQLTWFRNQFKSSDIIKLTKINVHTPIQICKLMKKG